MRDGQKGKNILSILLAIAHKQVLPIYLMPYACLLYTSDAADE